MDIRISTWNMHTPDDPMSTAKRRQTCTQLFFLCRFLKIFCFVYVIREHSLKHWQLFWRPTADNCNICCLPPDTQRKEAASLPKYPLCALRNSRPMTLVGGSQTTMTSNVGVGRSSIYRVAETINTKTHTAVRGCPCGLRPLTELTLQLPSSFSVSLVW